MQNSSEFSKWCQDPCCRNFYWYVFGNVCVYLFIYGLSLSLGGVVLLAVCVLSNGFDYIPKTALSAIIIAAVLYMVDIRIVYKIWTIRSEL